jgi:hypothetical protein
MLSLTFYADESGHSEDPTLYYAGMAGFVAPYSSWEVFDEQWRETMQNGGFTGPFHMQEFAHSTGQFKNWKGKEHETERQMFLGRLLEIIINTHATPIGAVVSLRDYESLTETQRNMFRDPYYTAFQTCTQGAAIVALHEEPSERVVTVYSFNEEYGVNRGGLAERLWHAMKKLDKPWIERLGSYGSSTPKELTPLQAADLFAYELCHEFENQIKRPQDGMRYPLRQILTMVNTPVPLIRLFDRSELLRLIKESGWPDQAGTEELLPEQMEQAAGKMTMWMYERGGVRLTRFNF